ncbi:MAG: DUF4175 domain-containing protein [Oscillochloris sp.]|nr:DUF4175 domain-containing protein [Oscillochloris sp.]
MLTRTRAPQRSRRSLQTQLDRLASDRWARRGVRILVRAAVLGIALVCVGVGLNLLLGWSLPWQWLAATALICIAAGAVLLLRPRLSADQVARRLDRRFQLHQQIATALELDAQPEGIAAHLDAQARQSLGQIRHYIAARQRFPWVELALVLALCVALIGLLILAGIVPPAPNTQVEPLPALVAPPDPDEAMPEEPFQPPPGSQPAPGLGSGESSLPAPADPAAAAALADALRDQSITRPAAESLDQGDVASAAQQLRELADQADGISQEARDDLAAALNDAAQELGGTNPDLAEQLAASAEALRSGNDAAAAEAFEDLAEAVESLTNSAGQTPGEQQGQGQQPGQGGGAGEGVAGEQREQPTDRLGVDGVPLELDSNGEPNTPTGNEADGSASGQGNGGFSQASRSPSSERVDVADDPLRIPTDLRDVVQDYFSP